MNVSFSSIRGVGAASGAFVGSFALHVVFGAADLGLLFKVAVVMIFASAVLFPVIALAASGKGFDARGGRGMVLLAMVVGSVLTTATLWAAADRQPLWWHPIAAPLLVGICNAILFGAFERLHPRLPAPAT